MLLAVCSLFITLAKEPPTVKAPALREELLERVERDQKARKALIPLLATGKPLRPDHKAIKAVREIDEKNRKWLSGVIDQQGWPGHSLVGIDGAHAAWLIVQHADADRAFQKQCLRLLETAVKNGDADGKDLAYLTDRVRVGDKQKQVYGTQLQRIDGRLVPNPIEDEERVDERRKTVGLPPLADYIKFAEKMYRKGAEKKQ